MIMAVALAIQSSYFARPRQHHVNTNTAYSYENQHNVNMCVGVEIAHRAIKSRAIAQLKGEPAHRLESEPHDSGHVDIRRLCCEGRLKEALEMLRVMDHQGIPVDVISFAYLLQACANAKALTEGKQVHAHVLMSGVRLNLFLENIIVSMYSKCGSMVDACHVFDKMSKRNVFTWNAMIRGYENIGRCEEALVLYEKMLREGLKPDNFTFPCVIQACACLVYLFVGKGIHASTIKSGLGTDIFVANTLLIMYAKCRCSEDAGHLFDKMSYRNVVSWTSMIAVHAENGRCNQALKIFRQMQLENVKPDPVTIATALAACTRLEDLKGIHDYISRNGFQSDCLVGNTLVAMYAKLGSVGEAHQVFHNMCGRDVVSWTAMIAGYVQNGAFNEAFKVFRQMQLTGIKPNSVTIASVLPSCARVATHRQGKEIHTYIVKSGLQSNIFVANALIDMYTKCGSLEHAQHLFDKMPEKDVVSWTTMIAGYGLYGQSEKALKVFYQMQQVGMQPNNITFTAVLHACSYTGLVDEAWHYFNSMSRGYLITPRVEHYACMVSLLGRAGHFDEARTFIKNMPLKPNPIMWRALLGACRLHCNVGLGERVAEHLLELEPENVGNYVLLSNIYAATGRWDGVAKMKATMRDMGLEKRPGCSWIEVKNKVHTFLVGDLWHPQSEKIYATLESLSQQMEEAGYVADLNFALHDVDEERECIPRGHSEKLAIAFGLINTCPGTPIRITKNLRMCGDCHSAAKFISKIVRREIILRDADCFHHFKAGFCSCSDYW